MRKNVIDMYYAQAQMFVKVFFAVCLLALGLVPEVLDADDGVFLFREQLGVLDAEVREAGHVEHVVGARRDRVDNLVGHDLGVDDGLQRLSLHIGNDFGIDLTASSYFVCGERFGESYGKPPYPL